MDPWKWENLKIYCNSYSVYSCEVEKWTGGICRWTSTGLERRGLVGFGSQRRHTTLLCLRPRQRAGGRGRRFGDVLLGGTRWESHTHTHHCWLPVECPSVRSSGLIATPCPLSKIFSTSTIILIRHRKWCLFRPTPRKNPRIAIHWDPAPRLGCQQLGRSSALQDSGLGFCGYNERCPLNFSVNCCFMWTCSVIIKLQPSTWRKRNQRS